MSEPMDIGKIAWRRGEALKRAWAVLQRIRMMLEISRGEPIPRASAMSIDQEGEILCAWLALELSGMHGKVNEAVQVMDDIWRAKNGGDTSARTNGRRLAAMKFPKLSPEKIREIEAAARAVKVYFPPPPAPPDARRDGGD